MNYTIENLPQSGPSPVVYFDIGLKGEILGRLSIRLYRDVFPAGVENFVKIAEGKTYRVIERNGTINYTKQIRRSYEGCHFFRMLHNHYLVSGDIYKDNGTQAGTIYHDYPIEANLGDYYYSHDSKGLISLVPFYDDDTQKYYYDSTFMILLDDANQSNRLKEMDDNQVLIGEIYDGLPLLDKINRMIKPYANRKYPAFYIAKSGVLRQNGSRRRHRVSQKKKSYVKNSAILDNFKIE